MIRQSFGFNLSSDMTPSNGYKVSDPLALEKSWMHDAPRFCNMMGYVANGAAMAPGLMMVLPSIYAAAPYVANGTVQMGRFTWSMANVYHKTFGMNGGYINSFVDGGFQMIANPNGDFNYYSFIGSGFLPGNNKLTVIGYEASTAFVNIKSNAVVLQLPSTKGSLDQSSTIIWNYYGTSKWGTPILGLYWNGATKTVSGEIQKNQKNDIYWRF